MTNGATFGVLASRDGVETTGDVSFQGELVRQWITQPSASKGAIEFQASKLAIGAAVNVDGPRAWLRVEKAELGINGGSWLDDFVPEMRLSFDATAEATLQDGVRFKGGVGGDVLIPVNVRIPILIGSARIEAIHLKAVLGSVDGEFAFGIEATANLTLELLSVITLHADGLGARFTVGHATGGSGNVAGIGKAGWSAAIPKGAGLEINVLDKIVGGGALIYDETAQRLGGAFKLVLADRFVLSALGIYQRSTATSPKSWLVLAALQATQTGPGFSVRGIGLLYGSNRTTDPDAFLAGIATGDLDAVLFPDDPIGKAAQYLAALERLFPTKQDAAVIGLSVQFSALDGRITFDLGVILDFHGSSLVAGLPGRPVRRPSPVRPQPGERIDPASQAVYVLADGVAIFDTRTDELNVRIALRNSHIWKGELTGGASVFHGSPQMDGAGRGTYVSIGGFHPDYVPPGTKIFVPPRLSLVLGKGDHLKLQVTSYLAYTPSSIQFGISGRLDARLYGFGIRGSLSLDVLAGFDGQFSVDLAFSVELLVGSHSLAAVAFSGSLVGVSPTILSGKASVSFLFFSISVHGSLTIHDDDAPDPSIDVTGTVLSAISAPSNWDTGDIGGLKLVDRERDGVWLSPAAPLRMTQPVVPFDVPIERYGPQRLAGPQTFSVEQVTVGSVTAGPHTRVGRVRPRDVPRPEPRGAARGARLRGAQRRLRGGPSAHVGHGGGHVRRVRGDPGGPDEATRRAAGARLPGARHLRRPPGRRSRVAGAGRALRRRRRGDAPARRVDGLLRGPRRRRGPRVPRSSPSTRWRREPPRRHGSRGAPVSTNARFVPWVRPTSFDGDAVTVRVAGRDVSVPFSPLRAGRHHRDRRAPGAPARPGARLAQHAAERLPLDRVHHAVDAVAGHARRSRTGAASCSRGWR